MVEKKRIHTKYKDDTKIKSVLWEVWLVDGTGSCEVENASSQEFQSVLSLAGGVLFQSN